MRMGEPANRGFGIGVQAKVLNTFQGVPSSLGSGPPKPVPGGELANRGLKELLALALRQKCLTLFKEFSLRSEVGWVEGTYRPFRFPPPKSAFRWESANRGREGPVHRLVGAHPRIHPVRRGTSRESVHMYIYRHIHIRMHIYI